MEYHHLTPETQEIVDRLRYNSMTVECDVLDALEGAVDQPDFVEHATEALRVLQQECESLINDLGGGQDVKYVVQLENGAFLEAGDDLYIFPTLESAKEGVEQYERYFDMNPGAAVVNLFQIIQARWDNGEPLT